MVPPVTRSEPEAAPVDERSRSLSAFRSMLKARLLEDKLASLYRAGKIAGGVYLGRGQEALSASIGVSLRPGDVFAPLIRDGAGRLAFGESVIDAVRTYLGSAAGPMRGRDGNIHRGRPKDNLLPMISHLGAMISVVNGVLLARRMKGIKNTVGATCLGEGGTSTGSFHEGLNQAAVEKLPLVLVLADNQYAYSTPRSKQFACRDLAEKAAGYGVASHSVDGTDLKKCLETLGRAVDQARNGEGPQLVVAQLLRLCGHGEHDDSSYIDPALRSSTLGRDCLKMAEEWLAQAHGLSSKTVEEWRGEFHAEIDDTVARVQREAGPDPFTENWRAISSEHLVETFHELEMPAVST